MLSLAGISEAVSTEYFRKEDYYFGGGLGSALDTSGKKLFDLGSKVDKWKFRALVEARIEETGGAKGRPNRVADDLTFSAPKSVSLLAALGDGETRQKVIGAHQEAVETVVKSVEEFGFFQARGEDKKPVAAIGMVALRFDHFTNRNGDPLLHSHVLIANLAVRQSDGKVVSAYLRDVYLNKQALGALYRLELASRLEKLGYEVEWQKDGFFELKGFTKEQLKEFSTRRQEIEAALIERGLDGGKAAEVAALDTRKSKVDLDPSALRQSWEEKAKGVGLKLPSPNLLAKAKRNEHDRHESVQKTIKEVFLGQVQTTGFTQDHRIVMESAKELSRAGITTTKEETLSALGQVKAELSDKLVGLKSDRFGRERFTTKDVLFAEQKIRDLAETTKPGLEVKDLELKLESFQKGLKEEQDFELSREQLETLKGISAAKSDVILIGKAGTGKTTTLQALKEVYEGKILGVSVGGAAASNLEKETGIKSLTIDSLALKPDRAEIAMGGLIVVDEAGMVDSHRAAAIMEIAKKYQAKICWVGDPDQLKPVGAGDPLSRVLLVAEHLPHFTLEKIYRQKIEEYREAAQAIAHGDVRLGWEKLESMGKIHEISAKGDRVEAIKEEYLSLISQGKKALIVTSENAFKDRLNREIRYELVNEGLVEKEGLRLEVFNAQGKSIGEREFAPGDRIIFLRNNRELEIQNGLQGEVVSIDTETKTLEIRTDHGHTIALKADDYRYLDHAYAATVYKAQGISVDKVIYAVDSRSSLLSKNEFYVAVTRGREDISIYTDDKDKTLEKIQQSQEKTDVYRLGKDAIDSREYEKWSATESLAERLREMIQAEKESQENKEAKTLSVETSQEPSSEKNQEQDESKDQETEKTQEVEIELELTAQ